MKKYLKGEADGESVKHMKKYLKGEADDESGMKKHKGKEGPYSAVGDAAADVAAEQWDAAIPTMAQWAPARYVIAAARASQRLTDAAADAAADAACGMAGGKCGKGGKHYKGGADGEAGDESGKHWKKLMKGEADDESGKHWKKHMKGEADDESGKTHWKAFKHAKADSDESVKHMKKYMKGEADGESIKVSLEMREGSGWAGGWTLRLPVCFFSHTSTPTKQKTHNRPGSTP
jgi:hypothetical protein